VIQNNCSSHIKETHKLQSIYISAEILQARREWDDIFKAQKDRKNYKQKYFTRKSCCTEIRKKRLSQRNKNCETLIPPDLTYKKC
jgi:hypothetical protein